MEASVFPLAHGGELRVPEMVIVLFQMREVSGDLKYLQYDDI